ETGGERETRLSWSADGARGEAAPPGARIAVARERPPGDRGPLPGPQSPRELVQPLAGELWIPLTIRPCSARTACYAPQRSTLSIRENVTDRRDNIASVGPKPPFLL